MTGVGRRIGLQPVRVPVVLDRILSLLKYVVLGLILYFTWNFNELYFRVCDPCYALISRHGEDITFWAYVVLGAIVVGSLLMTMPFCRWLCPLAAVMNPLSRFGLLRVRRDADSCNDCGLCARKCPMAIPVDKVKEVTHARCTTCLSCVDACPKSNANCLTLGPPNGIARRGISRWVLIGLIVLLTAATVTSAKLYNKVHPSFTVSHVSGGGFPKDAAHLELMIEGVGCRGKCNRLDGQYLHREDAFAIDGYLGLQAWPGTGASRVRVFYDPTKTNPDEIKTAITEAVDLPDTYWQQDDGHVPQSHFTIVGYDPMALPDLPGLQDVPALPEFPEIPDLPGEPTPESFEDIEVPEIDDLPELPELPPMPES